MVTLDIAYCHFSSRYQLVELESYEIDNLKVQISFDVLGRVNIYLSPMSRGAPPVPSKSVYICEGW